MYVREEDIFSAVYYQLKLYINHLFITKDQYEQEIQHLDSLIEAASLKYEKPQISAWSYMNSMLWAKVL